MPAGPHLTIKYYKIQNRSKKNLILVYLEGPLPNLGSLTVTVHCTYMDDVIQCPLCILYIVNRSAEVREYKRVHKLVNREDKSMSHICFKLG